ncbi:hypothetical protein L6Q96_21945 [Candidatus Binatia bacterium]|nr:hypothetical protein [Candidatus Binatia bacterium]
MTKSVAKVALVPVLIFSALASMAGCSARESEHVAPTGQPVASVGKVVVTVAPSLAADNKTIIDEVNGLPRLRAAIEGELSKKGKLDENSPRVLNVEITDFRLRSGALVFWLGIMAGVDTLDVGVQVRDGEQVVRSYTTGVGSSGIAGGLTSSSRFQPMADVVAERVVEQL